MVEPHNNSEEHRGAIAGNLTLKDVDALLELFRRLQDLFNFKKPSKNQELWKQCLKKAEEELVEKLKKRQSQFMARPGRNVPPRKTGEDGQENLQKIILGIAEKKYRLMDSKYNQALLQVEEKSAELVKEIDHNLYSIREPLLRFDRARGTLLEANWRQIRDYFSVDEIMQFQAQGLVERAIDALEAIRAKVERQQQIELAEKPAETGQNATHAKCGRIWTCIKRIPRWIYVLVIFFAGLLAIVYYLWWLWTTFGKK